MSEICNICLLDKPLNTYCTSCSILLCVDCIESHVNQYEIKHKIINYEIYLQESERNLIERKQTMRNINSSLKEKLLEANLEIDGQFKQVSELINNERNCLKAFVDTVYSNMLAQAELDFESNTILFQSILNEVSIDDSIKSLTLDDTGKMVYTEKIIPAIPLDLETHILKQLSFDIEVYPTAKPIYLYSIKFNSCSIFQFDILTEEETIINIKNFKFKSYGAWCLIGSEIVYTGGWTQGNLSNEVFLINTLHWTLEPKPGMIIPRYQHGLACLNETVYAFGGATATGISCLCEKWEIGSKTWTPISNMNTPKAQMGICIVNEEIYISGDMGIEKYDPITDTFIIIPVAFETSLLSVLVPKEDSILIFRGSEASLLELHPSPMMFKLSEIGKTDLWSTTHPVHILETVYFVSDNSRIVYCYDLQEKTFDMITDLNSF
jgi:B-box zinc finger/Kelch motif